jgi:serine/threonine-protein kinase HipA
MARNQHAVIWTRLSGPPRKMGDLVLSGDFASFTYTKEYLASGQPGFCLLGDGSIWGTDTVTYPVSERIPVFPRLISLIPGNNPRNLQRRHYLDILRTRLGKEPPPGMETEWQLLLMGGHGGIGHIDVFSDDIAAEAWYRPGTVSSDPATVVSEPDSRSQLWRMLKRNVLDENVDFDPQVVEQTLGPTPSVGGMIPKLLVSIDTADSEPAFYPPATKNKKDVVLKIEPPEYTGMLDLEALCLDIHREAGFDVPAYHRYDDGDLHFLAVERFDRVDNKPVPMESLFSVIATGDHSFRETGDILLDELGDIIERLGQVTRLKKDTGEQLYRRILMALLTGNGDLHLDNIALLGGVSDCRLTPVYDPAPMRAWPRHNLVSAIPFDPADYDDHGAFFVALGKSFGLSPNKVQQGIHDTFTATSSYAERVMELDRVPLKQRDQLVDIVKKERLLLEKHSEIIERDRT